MGSATKQANFLLPEELIEELKRAVPKREQSKIVAEALKKELKRIKLKGVLQSSFGVWKEKDHPELKEGAKAFIRRLRRSTRLSRP
ncbi:MAG: hypothetical protein HY034_09490 [Nitrospirae bacterium]|nr:hypothetical protein [Nitrospirota bacterium]